MPDATSVSSSSIDTFGELLRFLRQRAGLTQQEFGLVVGYSHAQIARLEGGKRLPDVTAVRSLFVEALGLRPDSEQAAQLIGLAATAHEVTSAESAAEEQQVHIPNNLPVQATSFIGRERELGELHRLLTSSRLLILTGSGGTGKTRLALQLAAEMIDEYPDGAWLVELAPVTDPAFVPRAVAAVLGVREESSRPLLASLLDDLRGRRILLIFDNCEHLIDACAQFADAMLRSNAAVRILATSREGLNVPGEVAWRVASLQTPAQADLLGLDELAQFESVRLFVERARAVLPSFTLTAENAPVVRQIVTRLDGIPLAIELAAARVRALTPEQIASRLNDRFRLLTGGSRTALPRQQTLRATIDWSHALLHEAERVLLRRLSVFLGGFTLEAAEAVCADTEADRADVLDLLTALVDKSLVQYTDAGDEGRYWLLETIRQYAREKLIEGEADAGRAVRDRHLRHFAQLSLSLRPNWYGKEARDQVTAMRRVDLEADNFRQALEWAMETGQIDTFWRLNESLGGLWLAGNLLLEYKDRLNRFLGLPGLGPEDPYRARAYLALSDLHFRRSELAEAYDYAEKALATVLALNDKEIRCIAYEYLAYAEMFMGDTARARAHLAAGDALRRDLPPDWDPASNLPTTTNINYGQLALCEGDYARARDLFDADHAIDREMGNLLASSAWARYRGYAQMYLGEHRAAGQSFRESLIDNRALSDRAAVVVCLAAFAGLALARGDLERAARLFGSYAGLSEKVHVRMMPLDRMTYERNVGELRKRMDSAALEAAWKQGRAMTYNQAIEYALQEGEPDEPTESAGVNP